MRTFAYIPCCAALLAVALVAVGVSSVSSVLAAEEATDSDTLTDLEAKRFAKITETIQVLQAKGDVAGMVALYRKGMVISPQNLTAREAYVELGATLAGYALAHKADPAQVLDLLNEFEAYVGKEYAAPSAIWWLRTAALRRLGRTDEADALAQQARDFKPGDANYHRFTGFLLMNADLYDEAITELEAALAAAEDDWVRGLCAWAIAATHLKAEHYEGAALQYEHAVAFFKKSRQPRNYDVLIEDAASAMYHLGRYHELRGRHKETIAANERALELMPEPLDETLGQIATQNIVAIGDAYIKLGKPKKALEQLERAAMLAPKAPGVYASLGDAHAKLGDTAKATAAHTKCDTLYRDLITRRPNHPMPYNNLAWFLVTRDLDLDEALKLSKTSVELSPDTAAYLDTLAEIYYRMGEHQKAIEWITKALELDPKPRHLIYFEQQLGKFKKAQEKAE